MGDRKQGKRERWHRWLLALEALATASRGRCSCLRCMKASDADVAIGSGPRSRSIDAGSTSSRQPRSSGGVRTRLLARAYCNCLGVISRVIGLCICYQQSDATSLFWMVGRPYILSRLVCLQRSEYDRQTAVIVRGCSDSDFCSRMKIRSHGCCLPFRAF